MPFQDKIRNPKCKLCALHQGAEFVCLMGTGTKKAEIMIVGEAPGEREDESHQAFVGPAGRLLREELKRVGISPRDCYITNVAKCRPPNNRAPEKAEIKVCVSNYLTEEIRKVQPRIILCLGNSALYGLLGRSGITKHRGNVVELGGAQVLPAFHPAYCLRAPQNLPALRADFERLARLVDGRPPDADATRVKIIKSKDHLRWLIRELNKAKHIAWDIETYTDLPHKKANFEEWHGDKSMICSIAFAWKEGLSAVVPLHHEQSPWRSPDSVWRLLKPCLERTDAKYITHNGKFDARWAAAKGIFIRQDFDTMLAAHMLEENRPKGLKPLSQVLLGVDAYDVGEELGDAYHMNLRKLCIYNARDADYTLRLYHRFKEELKEEPRIARVFMLLMMPASNELVKVETIGPYIDPHRYKKRLKEAHKKRDEIEAELRKSCGDINLRSPQQISKWMFGKKKHGGLGLQPVLFTDKGNPSTNVDVIKRLSKQAPAVAKLEDYRWWETKVIRTYFANWANVDKRSRFHPGYKLFGTVTGRISGDFQQVPRDPFMRSIVGAPPGWFFVEADYSQIELRIAAMLAGVRKLLRIYAEGGDAHLATAVDMTKKRPEDILPEERKKAKPVNFGFLYGMGYKKFVDYAFTNYGVVVTEDEAYRYRERYFEAYPELLVWHQRQRRLVHRYQRVSSPIGRVRHLPDVLSSDRGVSAEAERQAINSPVQSFASDLMLLSLVQLSRLLSPRHARIVGTVHDSILFEVAEGAMDTVLPRIKTTMEDMSVVRRKFGTEVTVPIEVEIKYGSHWSDPSTVVWQP